MVLHVIFYMLKCIRHIFTHIFLWTKSIPKISFLLAWLFAPPTHQDPMQMSEEMIEKYMPGAPEEDTRFPASTLPAAA